MSNVQEMHMVVLRHSRHLFSAVVFASPNCDRYTGVTTYGATSLEYRSTNDRTQVPKLKLHYPDTRPIGIS